MKRLLVGGMCLAGVLAFSMVALAQSGQPPTSPAQPPTAQQPEQSPAQQEAKAPEQQVTIIGCVQKEADYRQAKNLGRGGAAGTGVGAGNEFVLINAAIQMAATTEPAPTGTAGAPAGTDEFELTGSNEMQVEPFVGKRVEITGKLKPAETRPSGATGGATEAMPGSRDLKLREVDVVSVKETAGTCPAGR
jgi:hypothetical protein